MTSTNSDVHFDGESEGEKCFVCSGPVSVEERDYLVRNDFLELGSDGDYHEKSTLCDSDSEWDSDDRTFELNKADESFESIKKESVSQESLSEALSYRRDCSPSQADVLCNASQNECMQRSVDEAPEMIWPGKSNTTHAEAKTTLRQSNPEKSFKIRRNTLSRVIKSIKSLKAKVHKST
ncbi:unnamed protein product [Allacma fusca]|uniref:Uncharacterized protein n=1 Tax=Allacma fusca TaxID=39272 RepID=A0A8J2P6L1_9HEXA|nr:unnamed protein product [Allacma fusca]